MCTSPIPAGLLLSQINRASITIEEFLNAL